eukprot:3100739-Prymnesium_polylepis.1
MARSHPAAAVRSEGRTAAGTRRGPSRLQQARAPPPHRPAPRARPSRGRSRARRRSKSSLCGGGGTQGSLARASSSCLRWLDSGVGVGRGARELAGQPWALW